jgi:hypothetical protein
MDSTRTMTPHSALESVQLFVATQRENVPCAHYVSVDGTVPGCLVAWDHHVSGEPINLDALPRRIDLAAIARAHGVPRIEGIGTTWADADAVASAVAVLLGGPDALDPHTRDLLASASHWCDHLRAHPAIAPERDALGRGLSEWIARELRVEGDARFAHVVTQLCTTVRAGAPLPFAEPDPAVEAGLARILAEGRLRVVAGVAVVDQRDLPSLPPLRVHGLHAHPLTVVVQRHDDGRPRYVVGVNPHVPHPSDLSAALAAIAAAEHAHGPPALRATPGPGSENWGGRATVFGSPWNYGSRLDPDEVARLTARALLHDTTIPQETR